MRTATSKNPSPSLEQSKRGRPPSSTLELRPGFLHALENIEHHGINRFQVWKSIRDLCSRPTFDAIVGGSGKQTAVSLSIVSVIAEVIGGTRRDDLVAGVILDPPPVAVTIRALRRLASDSPQARAFVVRRLEALADLHSSFALVELPPAQEVRA